MRLRRREALLGSAAALALRCGSKSGSYELGLTGTESYDEVLAANFKTDFEFPTDNFYTNHIPMVADALAVGGRGDRLAAWAEQYGKDLRDNQAKGEALPAAERAGAINKYPLRQRWVETYLDDLKTLTPRQLLNQEWPLLRAGMVGSLWHGVLRAGHAARALDREDTEVRRREFAEGLAYWAARCPVYTAVPGARAQSGRDLRTALKSVPLVPASQQITRGDSEPRFQVVNGRSDFTDFVETIDLDALPASAAMTEVVAAAARLFVTDGARSIHLIHVITGTSAVRLLIPWLAPAAQREALGYAFVGVASAIAGFGKSSAAVDPVAAPTRSLSSLRTQGLASSDAHDIKLTEVVAREATIEERPELITALEKQLA